MFALEGTVSVRTICASSRNGSEYVMKIVYFDTNVFDHIHKRLGVADSDLSALYSAVKAGKISILLSVLNLEEILAALDSCPDLAMAELRLILDLADWQRFVKPTNMLLSDDISCYARADGLTQPFVTDPILESNLQTLVTASPKDIAGLWASIKEETRKQKEGFRNGMRATQQKILPRLKQLQGRNPNFNEYWKIGAEKLAEAFADRVGVVESCRKRGLADLLEIRSVRMCAGVSLSLIYAQDFEGRTPKIDDSRDLQHAVLATAADIFVTHDRKFATLVDRIQIDDFQVVNLDRLLSEIPKKI